jgi:hypothetical protein
MSRTFALLVAAVGISVAGCGDDDDDDDAVGGDAQPYVDAMIESFDSSDPEELQIDREQAQCLAPQWIETIGPERLAEAGIEPEDFTAEEDVDLSVLGLSDAEADELYDAFATCDIDVREILVQSLVEQENLSEEDAGCVRDAFGEDLVRQLTISGLVEGEEELDPEDPLAAELLAALSRCPGLAEED